MIFKKQDKGNWDGIEKAAVMGTNFVAHTIVGLVLGYYCDKWFHTAPWGLLFWLIMGIIAGFRVMYLDAMKVSKTQELNTSSQEASPEAPPGAPTPGLPTDATPVAPEGKPGDKEDGGGA
jgi:ATP synthase protein I